QRLRRGQRLGRHDSHRDHGSGHQLRGRTARRATPPPRDLHPASQRTALKPTPAESLQFRHPERSEEQRDERSRRTSAMTVRLWLFRTPNRPCISVCLLEAGPISHPLRSFDYARRLAALRMTWKAKARAKGRASIYSNTSSKRTSRNVSTTSANTRSPQ